MQYTDPSATEPGAVVDGRHIGKVWNTINQRALARRLEARGYFVLTPSITLYGEDLPGVQALEHFIASLHKGNTNVQTVLLTAYAHIPNAQNPLPGAQVLVTGTDDRSPEWEVHLQKYMAPF